MLPNEVIKIVLQELEPVWENARTAHKENAKNVFTAGRYEGLTQAITVITNIAARIEDTYSQNGICEAKKW